jgi:hypothetical protein
MTAKDTLDFVVIGAQKAGTTTVFEYLKRHPELYLPPRKETPYFSNDARVAQGWQQYIASNFAMSDPTLKWGTITTHYMAGGIVDVSQAETVQRQYDASTVPRRIRERLPDIRLIAILRDPVERAISHHKMAVMNGLDERSFERAIDDLLQPESLVESRNYPQEATSYITRGEYGRILSRYLEVFPREQLLVVFNDELERSPQALLQRMFEFIGVGTQFIPDNLGVRYREAAASRRLSWLNPDAIVRATAGRHLARKTWHLLPDTTRRRISNGYAGIAYQIELRNRTASEPSSAPASATVARLREHFAADRAELAMLLGDDLPW